MRNFFLDFLMKIDLYISNLYKDKYIPYRYSKIYSNIHSIRLKGILSTLKELLRSDKSLSRFGDGEIKWMLNIRKAPGFQKGSPLLQKKLYETLNNNNNNLLIGLPDCFKSIKYNTSQSKYFWERFCVMYGCSFIRYLNKHKMYYDTSVSRPYMDYNTNNIANRAFRLWKELWNNKNLLIVEGDETHLGVGDNLFNNTNKIKRIECPHINAFESYTSIRSNVIDFLNSHPNFLVILSLGPTATVLSCDLCNRGYRSIDVGHIDVEYDWFLKGSKEKIDLPYHYVNEVPNGRYSCHVYNKKYRQEVIKYIN